MKNRIENGGSLLCLAHCSNVWHILITLDTFQRPEYVFGNLIGTPTNWGYLTKYLTRFYNFGVRLI